MESVKYSTNVPPTRDDHGVGVPEWTPAGVCILN